MVIYCKYLWVICSVTNCYHQHPWRVIWTVSGGRWSDQLIPRRWADPKKCNKVLTSNRLQVNQHLLCVANSNYDKEGWEEKEEGQNDFSCNNYTSQRPENSSSSSFFSWAEIIIIIRWILFTTQRRINSQLPTLNYIEHNGAFFAQSSNNGLNNYQKINITIIFIINVFII